MSRLPLFLFLAAIFFCFSAVVTMEVVEPIVTICTVILAVVCVIAGAAAMEWERVAKIERCPHCGQLQRGHTCINLSDIVVRCVPHQRTSDIAPSQPKPLPDVGEERKLRAQRLTNIRRNAQKKGYGV
jgi:uncharacterized membrane protein